MLYECTRPGGSPIWRKGVPAYIIGHLETGGVCLALEESTPESALHIFGLAHWKVLYDGKVGYVVDHALKPLR